MEVLDTIKARRSVRAYEERDIPEDTLEKILEAGRIAPSASNQQPWHFIVVKDPAKRKTLSEGKYAHFLTQCPVVIVGCSNAEDSPKWYQVDVSIALENMVLAATSEGVGTCWIGSFDEDSVRRVLDVPIEFRIVAMLAMGYAKDKFDLGALLIRSKNRKAMKEITSFESFGNQVPK